jgi:hypothetical protein
MSPAAPFSPPSAELPGKPFVPEWIPPPVTQQKEQFAELTSIDLSLLDSDDPAVVQELVNQVKRAIREDGFLFLENYGVSLEQVRYNAFDVEPLSLTTYTTASSTVCYCPIHVQQHFGRGQRTSALQP